MDDRKLENYLYQSLGEEIQPKRLDETIKYCTEMDKNKQILSEAINRAVREAVNEKLSRENTIDMLVESVVSERLRMLREDDERETNKKRSVLQWLRQDEVNTAAIRRELEGEPESQEDEDAKRSYFMKKVNQSNGKDFSDEEVNQLYAIKSGLGQ